MQLLQCLSVILSVLFLITVVDSMSLFSSDLMKKTKLKSTATIQTAGSINWVNCGSPSDLLTIDSLEWSPSFPTKGTPFKVTFKGNLKDDITSTASVSLVAKFEGLEIYSKTYKLCDLYQKGFPGKQCPILKGKLEETFKQEVKEDIPELGGTVVVEIKGKVLDEKQIFCIKFNITL